MEITFDEGFSGQEQAELDAVLQRIGWRERPDSLHVRAKLTDGRSGCTVLDVVAHAGPRATSMVAKVGPFHDLKGEWSAFNEHLHDASALFAPILAVTPAVLGSTKPTGDREAVVYDHASRFVGLPDDPPVTFEELARQAICEGGSVLDRAEQALKTLFKGIQNDLYAKHEIDDRETSALDAWNLRLGIALEIEVNRFAKASRTFELSGPAGSPTRLYPLTLLEAADRHDAKVEPGAWVEIRDLKVEWWGDRLMGQLPEKSLRLEVVPIGGLSLRRTSKLAEGATFDVRGHVRSVRARAHHQQLYEGLPELAGARMADPFKALPRILEGLRRGRLMTLVHGDLNPRNILLAGDRPILIDYAFTRDSEPFFLDFTRLEGCLARDVLPEDLSLAQHLRLQRLLAAACRIGERGADRFAQSLAAERKELGAAFRILWTLRSAARDAYPEVSREYWLRDYLEQLFLFAHLTLKWPKPEQTPAALRATAAMAGVAVETLSGDFFRHWNEEELRGDGLEILRLTEPSKALGHLAAMARVLRDSRREEDKPLIDTFESLRADFVQSRFSEEANRILVDLEADHGVYISLLAYIDLRGRLHAARARQEMSFDAMLESDEALAEAELLRGSDGDQGGEDVLRLFAEQPEIVLIGDAGAGKSTVAREWQYRLAQAIAGRGETVATPRLPVVMRAPELLTKISERKKDDRSSIATDLGQEVALLDVGALHVTIDALNELPEADKQRVAEWLVALRTIFPATPVVACHRQYNYTPGLLPFPVVGLEKVELEQARRYVFDYLREKGAVYWQELGERLAALLLDDPEHAQVRDLAQTPLFLWMIVERYRQTHTPPAGRGRLFEDFSRWYLEEKHHKEHGEAVANRFTFDEKAAFLGKLGYALVERGITDIKKTEVAKWRAKPAMLAEILTSEILLCDDGKLRFLHQSFQEYFAARHFLAHEASDSVIIQKKVWRLGWHDTFAVLLGFAGESPEVVAAVVEAALAVNPVLTARCLRMAEAPVDELLARFVAAQERVLRDPEERGYGHQRAARALAEHGRGLSRQALLKIAADPTTPVPARAEILRILPGLSAQMRFEPVREKMRDELHKLLGGIFDDEAPEEVRQAAIEAVAEAVLHKLSGYLIELVQSESRWKLRRAAWSALGKLGVRPTPRQQAAFVRACKERLTETETALYEESVTGQMDALNAERVEILEQIATPEHLPVLLKRRFRYRINEEVRQIIDQVIIQSGEVPEEARTAWEILTEESDEIAVARWWQHVREGLDLNVSAAAHRLAALGGTLQSEPLHSLLASDFDPGRLAAIVEICGAARDRGLVEPMEKLARSLIDKVEGIEAVEAFTQLINRISKLKEERGRRLAALASMVFDVHRREETRQGFYPWFKFRTGLSLSDMDCNILLSRGADDAKAAIWDLCVYGGGAVLVALPPSPVIVIEENLERFREIAEKESDLDWQRWIAQAAVKLRATDLLPQLLLWANKPEHTSWEFTDYHSRFGQIRERSLAFVLRVIGYLARLLYSNHPVIAFLDARAATLDEAEDRSIVVGCTTALGYLGKWEPILTYLGPGEPWMHEAAHNVFNYWVSKDLQERERAARWIARRLHTHRDLAPEVRSTLGKLLERLEQEIGFHVGGEEGGG